MQEVQRHKGQQTKQAEVQETKLLELSEDSFEKDIHKDFEGDKDVLET